MLWSFVEACVGGKLRFDECSPVFYLVGIGVAIVVAVCVLVASLLQRRADSDK